MRQVSCELRYIRILNFTLLCRRFVGRSCAGVLDGADSRVADAERRRDCDHGAAVQRVAGAAGHVGLQRPPIGRQPARQRRRHAQHDVGVHRSRGHVRRRNLHRHAGKPARKVHLLDPRQSLRSVAFIYLPVCLSITSARTSGALTLLVGRQEGHPAGKKTEWWGAGVVICLERRADLHMAQLMLLPLTVSCFSKIQIGSAFLVPAHPGSPGQRAVKRVCVCLSIYYIVANFLTALPVVEED